MRLVGPVAACIILLDGMLRNLRWGSNMKKPVKKIPVWFEIGQKVSGTLYEDVSTFYCWRRLN